MIGITPSPYARHRTTITQYGQVPPCYARTTGLQNDEEVRGALCKNGHSDRHAPTDGN